MKVFYDEHETPMESFLVTLGGFFLVPYVVMLSLGALAHRHNLPQIALGYWDVVLVGLVLALVRGRKVSRFYRRTK
jgi:hypothetical protein